jgi:hypothetical protein
MPTLAELEAGGQIEVVQADPETSRDELAMATRHLSTAREISDSDPVVAYAALYDATRKAISAHMRRRGYRATSGAGHHAKTIAYARAALAGLGVAEELSQLDWMRRIRNGSEYDARSITTEQVLADLTVAEAIVQAVQNDLGPE